MTKKILSVIATAAFLFGMTTGNAAAAPACKWQGCTGWDPQSSGCAASGVNMDTRYSQYGSQVELRFSTECRAFWVRIARSSGVHYATGLVEGWQGRDRQDAPATTGITWSPMMFDGSVHACVTEWWNGVVSPAASECTMVVQSRG
ncbi:Protein of unknown function [Lentzea xinjiangensis]|uniref:DUF2690 domain-containing protein n=1 Tax=Lentzea xinjiangensis TaxID=402600 RepID=A0A1H9F5I1_9PSEU|nr:DUF2690 domain-containing protein [Lentzea xinjiangensis]SEQ33181.1 Protein of unknown function [Lentzea xinjiangensis]